MKKTLAVIAIGLVAAAAGSSYLGHSLAQQSFDTQVEALRKLAPTYRLSVQEAELKQGLFGADARISVFFDSPDAEIPSMTLLLQSALQYGPLLLTDSGVKLGLVTGKSTLAIQGLSEENANKLEAMIGPHLLSGEHWVDFKRQLVANVQAPGFEISEGTERFSFAGVQALIRSDLDSRQTSGDLTLGSFNINSPEGTLAISTGHARFESADIENYMAPSRFELHFPQIDANEPNIAISLKDVSIALQQSLENGRINVTETFKVAQITSPLPLSSASASFTFNQINPEGIKLWGEIINNLDASDMDSGIPEIAPEQVRELISALLQPGLAFIQSYQLSTAEGSLDANLSIEFQGLADGLHLMDIDNPRQLLNALKAELSINADQQAIMTLPVAPMVSAYVEQGFVIQDQHKLRLDALLHDGKLNINGQPFPLDSWL